MIQEVYKWRTERERLAHPYNLMWDRVSVGASQFGDGDVILFAVPICVTPEDYRFEYHVVTIECESLYQCRYICGDGDWQWQPSDAAWFVRLN